MTPSLPELTEFALPTFQQFLEGRPAPARQVTAPYAHPMDRAIIERLSRTSLQHPVDRLVELVMHYIFTPLVLNSIPVVSRSFPHLNQLRAQAAETLGIPVPEMYARQLADLGMIFTIGTDEEHFILIETTFEHLATRDELLFVIGHECGHIHNHHVTYRVLAAVLLEGAREAGLLSLNPVVRSMAKALGLIIGPSLAAWSRRAEITADRAGLLCCRNLEAAQRAFLRLVIGFTDEANVEIDDYVRTMRERTLPSSTARFSLIDTTHPTIPVRLQALQLFHESELYYELTGLPRPDRRLLPRDELEGRVAELVAIL